MLKNPALWKANAVVFVGGACTMVLELIAGRLLAPYIGVSLYTWTSIIGVVLAGISLGNYLGGRLADRYARPLTLGIVFLAAGLASLAILPGVALLAKSLLPTSIHLMNRALIYSALMFFVPTTILGMITPLVIKLTLQDLRSTGNIVGTIYAVSTVGAIVGTFATGFWLVSWFGTRTIVWLVAATLLLLGVVAGAMWKSTRRAGAVVAVLVLFGLAFLYRGSFQASFIRESNYYAINIYDGQAKDWCSMKEDRPVRALTLDRIVHSYSSLGDPTFLCYDYENIVAQFAAYQAQRNPQLRALFIGGGGYTLPRYMEVLYPQSSLEVVEIDPAVTETAYAKLGLPRDTRVRTYNQDARIFFAAATRKNSGANYNLVLGDAFNDFSIPYHLTTVEFQRMVKREMAADGFYLINVIDDYHQGRFMASLAQTLRQVFQNVFLVAPKGSLEGSGPGTYVLVATDGEFEAGKFLATPLPGGRSGPELDIVSDQQFAQYLEAKRPLVLTDNFVPVDNMISFIFAHQ